MIEIFEGFATSTFGMLVLLIAWADHRAGYRGPALGPAIAGGVLLFLKGTAVATVFWFAQDLIADAAALGEPARWELLLTNAVSGVAGGLLYAVGLGAIAAALYLRNRPAKARAAGAR